MKGISTANSLMNDIEAMARALTTAGVERVSYGFEARFNMYHVQIGERYSVYVPLNHDEVLFQLRVIRDRLDRLMDELPEVAA